jgi:hypothetical protein
MEANLGIFGFKQEELKNQKLLIPIILNLRYTGSPNINMVINTGMMIMPFYTLSSHLNGNSLKASTHN